MEDYLRAIGTLARRDPAVSVHSLATHLDVAAPSVSQMLKRLVAAGFVTHPRYGIVTLTSIGRAVAHDLMDRYDLLVMYLIAVLGYEPDRVQADADRIEHACSARLRARLTARLQS